MAKIKTITVELLGEKVDFEIKCSSKGVFSTDFPAAVSHVVKVTNEHPTFADLEREIYRAVREANAAKTETEDLIFYTVGGHIKNMDWEEQISDSCGLTFAFMALRRTTRGKKVVYNKIDLDVFDKTADPNGIAPGYRLLANTYSGKLLACESIPFSVDAMDFFFKMRELVGSIRDKITAFTKPESLLPLLAGGTMQLPFNIGGHGNQ